MRRISILVVLLIAFLFSSYKPSVVNADDCWGVCASTYIGGCVLVCQQMRCILNEGFYIDYSVTTAFCEGGTYTYPADFSYNCPCSQ